MTEIYNISLETTAFKNLVANAKQEEGRRGFKLKGVWITQFETLIKTVEKNEFSLKGKVARVNEDSVRSTANYFSATANCKDCQAEYSISLKQKYETDAAYISFTVERKHQHDHSVKKVPQIRGEERTNLAELVKKSYTLIFFVN